MKLIKELRTVTGMTQEKFSKYIGVSKRTVESWEQGRRRCPEYLIRLIQSKIMLDFLIKQ